MSIAQRLESIEVLDEDARPHRLGSAWADTTVVLVFIRHFG